MRLKKGDPVIIIAGNDKGKEGSVLSIDGDHIVIKGINIRKKHQKEKGQEKTKKGGSIIEFEAPIDISNVRYCAGGVGYKMRVRFSEDNKKEIYYKTKNGDTKVIRSVR